jgi:enamine deaminase RidA (YjgF/YER057c/UK114 family)
MKQQLVSPKLAQPNGHFSHATMIEARGRLVFISGMTARAADGVTITGVGDIEAQTRQVCENLKAACEAAVPASTMVEVSKMVKPEYLIEISAIAVIPE